VAWAVPLSVRGARLDARRRSVAWLALGVR
jgi:hypothetical protein